MKSIYFVVYLLRKPGRICFAKNKESAGMFMMRIVHAAIHALICMDGAVQAFGTRFPKLPEKELERCALEKKQGHPLSANGPLGHTLKGNRSYTSTFNADM